MAYGPQSVSLTQAGGDLDLLEALRGGQRRAKTQQEMLREQSMSPVEIGSYNGIQGKFPISQGLNKIAQGLLATYMDSQARDRAQAAADAQKDEAQKYAAGFAGTPAVQGSRPNTPEEIDAYQSDASDRAQGIEPYLGRPPVGDELPTPPIPPAGELGLGGQPAREAPTPAQRTAMILQGMVSSTPAVNRMATYLGTQDAADRARQENLDAATQLQKNRLDAQGFQAEQQRDRILADRAIARVPPGFQVNPDGSLTFIRGGPADPEYIGVRAKAGADAKSQGHPIPSGDRNKLVDAGVKLSELDRLGTTFEDNFGGFGASWVGDFVNTVGRNTPGKSPRADWWQGYQSLKNVIRNDQFGAALTKTEKGEFEKADINPGMSVDTIRNNVARQSDIVRGALERRGRSMLADGYNLEAIQNAVGAGIDFSKPGAAPPAPLPPRDRTPPTAPLAVAAPTVGMIDDEELSATHPTTGKTLVLRNGAWVDAQ